MYRKIKKIITFFGILSFLAYSAPPLVNSLSITDSSNSKFNNVRSTNTQNSLNLGKKIQNYNVVAYLPVGTVVTFPANADLSGLDRTKWLECNGSTFSSSQYPELAMVLTGATNIHGLPATVKLPNYEGANDTSENENIRERGRFLRGTADSSKVGTIVNDSIRDHKLYIPPHNHNFDGIVTSETADGVAEAQNFSFDVVRDGTNVSTKATEVNLDVHASYDAPFLAKRYDSEYYDKKAIAEREGGTFEERPLDNETYTYAFDHGDTSSVPYQSPFKDSDTFKSGWISVKDKTTEGTVNNWEGISRGHVVKADTQRYIGRTYGAQFSTNPNDQSGLSYKEYEEKQTETLSIKMPKEVEVELKKPCEFKCSNYMCYRKVGETYNYPEAEDCDVFLEAKDDLENYRDKKWKGLPDYSSLHQIENNVFYFVHSIPDEYYKKATNFTPAYQAIIDLFSAEIEKINSKYESKNNVNFLYYFSLGYGFGNKYEDDLEILNEDMRSKLPTINNACLNNARVKVNGPEYLSSYENYICDANSQALCINYTCKSNTVKTRLYYLTTVTSEETKDVKVKKPDGADGSVSGKIDEMKVTGRVKNQTDGLFNQKGAEFSVGGKNVAGTSSALQARDLENEKINKMEGYYKKGATEVESKKTETVPEHVLVRYFIRAEQ